MTAAPVPERAQARPERTGRGWGRVAGAAVAVTMLTPASWAVALLGFLAGGGIVLVAWPVVVLPTPTGLQNLLAGPISSLVFGTPSPSLVLIVIGGFAGAIAVVIAATLVGAWAERQGIAMALRAAADDGLAVRPDPHVGGPGRWDVAGIRLLSLVPVAAVAALAFGPVYDAAYRELVLPRDLATPLPIRVLGQAPWAVLAVALAWLVSDAAAAVGVRHLVVDRRPARTAWRLGWMDLVRRPRRVAATALFGVGVLIAVVGPSVAANVMGWGRLRDILEAGRDPLTVMGATLVWVAVWLGGVVLTGVGAAVRAAAWTLELAMRAADPEASSPG